MNQRVKMEYSGHRRMSNFKHLEWSIFNFYLFALCLFYLFAYLTYTQSTSVKCEIHEMPGWMNHKLESRLPGEISTTSDMQMIPL